MTKSNCKFSIQIFYHSNHSKDAKNHGVFTKNPYPISRLHSSGLVFKLSYYCLTQNQTSNIPEESFMTNMSHVEVAKFNSLSLPKWHLLVSKGYEPCYDFSERKLSPICSSALHPFMMSLSLKNHFNLSHSKLKSTVTLCRSLERTDFKVFNWIEQVFDKSKPEVWTKH